MVLKTETVSLFPKEKLSPDPTNKPPSANQEQGETSQPKSNYRQSKNKPDHTINIACQSG